jgi:hypothetical protein
MTKPTSENNTDPLEDDTRRGVHRPHLDSPTDPIVTVDTLAPYDLTEADVRRLWPRATPYIALDGRPCWLTADLRSAA